MACEDSDGRPPKICGLRMRRLRGRMVKWLMLVREGHHDRQISRPMVSRSCSTEAVPMKSTRTNLLRSLALVGLLLMTGTIYWWDYFPKNLNQAIQEGNIGAMRFYIWWSPGLINPPENWSETSGTKSPPLYQAVSAGRLQAVQFLVRRGARVRFSGLPKAVHLAILNRHPEIARFLVRKSGREDFYTAAGLADIGMMNRLVGLQPALLHARSRRLQRRAISYAIYSGQPRAVEWFLKRGFSASGWSRGRPLIWEAAIGARSLAIVRLLVREGADPDPKVRGLGSLIGWMKEDPRYVAPSQVPPAYKCKSCREIYLFLYRHAQLAGRKSHAVGGRRPPGRTTG